MLITLPGTSLPFEESAVDNAFGQISAMIRATGGLTLAQLSALTGLEGSTIQNWIKRGWVAPSNGKKYGERSVVRILLINIMRGTLRLEDIARLMRRVNGDVEDQGDDILHDTELYELLCGVIYEAERQRLLETEELLTVIKKRLPQRLEQPEREILSAALLIMTQSALSGYLRNMAESEFKSLEENKE